MNWLFGDFFGSPLLSIYNVACCSFCYNERFSFFFFLLTSASEEGLYPYFWVVPLSNMECNEIVYKSYGWSYFDLKLSRPLNKLAPNTLEIAIINKNMAWKKRDSMCYVLWPSVVNRTGPHCHKGSRPLLFYDFFVFFYFSLNHWLVPRLIIKQYNFTLEFWEEIYKLYP